MSSYDFRTARQDSEWLRKETELLLKYLNKRQIANVDVFRVLSNAALYIAELAKVLSNAELKRKEEKRNVELN